MDELEVLDCHLAFALHLTIQHGRPRRHAKGRPFCGAYDAEIDSLFLQHKTLLAMKNSAARQRTVN
jgi:hypothetical protein